MSDHPEKAAPMMEEMGWVLLADAQPTVGQFCQIILHTEVGPGKPTYKGRFTGSGFAGAMRSAKEVFAWRPLIHSP